MPFLDVAAGDTTGFSSSPDSSPDSSPEEDEDGAGAASCSSKSYIT